MLIRLNLKTFVMRIKVESCEAQKKLLNSALIRNQTRKHFNVSVLCSLIIFHCVHSQLHIESKKVSQGCSTRHPILDHIT